MCSDTVGSDLLEVCIQHRIDGRAEKQRPQLCGVHDSIYMAGEECSQGVLSHPPAIGSVGWLVIRRDEHPRVYRWAGDENVSVLCLIHL
mgnify:CR=1 FL=1